MTRFSTTLLAALIAAPAAANEFQPILAELAEAELKAVVSDPALIAAIRDQNARTADLSTDEIEALDGQWRAQIGGADAPLIAEVTGNSAAAQLREVQAGSGGLYSEIFVMDTVGLNVAASQVTSDYWQGDEAKWQESFGTGSVHFGEVEFDESSQSYLSQISLPVTDPETGEAIGAATFGVNVEMLP